MATATAKKTRRKASKLAGVSRSELAAFFARTLVPESFSDYCPNGLQVQGAPTVKKLVAGVTASAALIDAAVAAGADALLVHHGYFWRGEDPCITGMKYDRVARLVRADINLFAFHLPLDAHAEFGNNVQLAARLGLPVTGRCGAQDLVFWSDLPRPVSAKTLAGRIEKALQRKPLVVGPAGQTVSRVAWCTGGAQDYIDAACDAGADLFISGEISERTTHIARERGITYVAAGHHATERYGVQALGAAAATELGLEFEFIDDPNPA